MRDFINDQGGRKFILAVTLTIGFFFLAIFGKISYEQLISGVTWVFGLFAGANVAQKFAPEQE